MSKVYDTVVKVGYLGEYPTPLQPVMGSTRGLTQGIEFKYALENVVIHGKAGQDVHSATLDLDHANSGFMLALRKFVKEPVLCIQEILNV